MLADADPAATWSSPRPDTAGEPYRARSITLGERRDGGESAQPDIAVVVHRDDVARHPRAVVYLPGFIDAFFHPHMVDALAEAGWGTYALEMRRSGRALLPGQRRDDVRDLRVRNEEISQAVRLARQSGAGEVVLLGHSTGGLQALLYAAELGGVAGVALNSPWLDLARPWIDRVPLTAVLKAFGHLVPRLPVSKLDGDYGRWVSDPNGGGWAVPAALKPAAAQPVRAGFIRTVRTEQARVARGMGLRVPVFMATSDRSGPRVNPSPRDLDTSDVVLNVSDMHRLSPQLSSDLTRVVVRGGTHDLALSHGSPRHQYFAELIRWLNRR